MIGLLLDPSKTVGAPSPTDPVHIIREEDSPPEADYWTMYCGLVVRAYDDGRVAPQVDFLAATHGGKASCQRCRTAWSTE